MPRKKGTGIGSVYYNKPRKNWIASFEIIDKESKEEKRVRKTFATKEEAERYLRIIQYQKNNEIFIRHNSIPLFELMKLITKRKLETNQIGQSAYNRLKSTLNVIEKSSIAHKDINDITSDELQEYFNSLTNYSNSYIMKLIEQFSQAFRYAMNKGFLLLNPMYDTIIPKSEKQNKEVRALDLEEQQKLTDFLMNSSTEDIPYKTSFLIEMYMGLRVGEVAALRKSNIDLRHNVIHVSNTLIRDGDGKRVMGNTTKSKAGVRDVPIPVNIRKEIIEQMQLADCHRDGLLFVSNAGTYADPSNINHVFKKICKKLGIKDVSTHTLRHTFGTRCIEAGMRAVALQRLMGHSNVSITLNVYTSVFNKYKESELDKVNNYYINNELFKNTPNTTQMLENTQESHILPVNNGREFNTGKDDYER